MTNTEVIHAWFENLWNRGDETTIDKLAAPNMVGRGLGPMEITSREDFRAFYRSFRATFPSVIVSVDRVVEAGEFATALLRVKVTAANGGGPYRFDGSVTVRIVEARIVEGWNYFDFLSLLTQMGAVGADAMPEALMSASMAPISATPARS